MALGSGQVGYPQSPIYAHRGGQQSGNYASPIYKQEPGTSAAAAGAQYSPAYGTGPSVVSPAYANPNASGAGSNVKPGGQNYVSPIYSPSACI